MAGLLVLAGQFGVPQPTSAEDGKFVNLSTRALVETGEEVMISGIIIHDGPKEVLIQALGPELVNAGIANALADPVLTVTDTTDPANPRLLRVNDNWEDSQGERVTDLWGGNPNLTPGSLSSAVVITLQPGNYSAKVEGKDNTAGVAIVEVYGIGSTARDRSALVALYNATDGPNWTNSENWLSDAPLAEWYGVEVNGQGRVSALDMTVWTKDEDGREYKTGNGLKGEIPSELGNLNNLTWLDLSDNELSGPVPSELGYLANLQYLLLDNNDLSGPLPCSSFTDLNALGVLSLNGTGLCAPTSATFRTWLEGIAIREGVVYCQDRDASTPKIYWTESRGIFRANLDGSNIENLLTGLLSYAENPEGLALDLVGGKIYWTGQDTRGFPFFARANLDGSDVGVLFTLRDAEFRIVDFALDVVGGKMYWMREIGPEGWVVFRDIWRSNLDGSDMEVLLLKNQRWQPQTYWYKGFALDVVGGKMYLADAGFRKIHRANLDGSDVEFLVSTGYFPDKIALDVVGGKMYWGTPFYWNFDTPIDCTIERANLDGSDVEVLISGLELHPIDIALDVVGGKMYWIEDSKDGIHRANLDGSDAEHFLSGVESPRAIVLDPGYMGEHKGENCD